jgi:hypothetical protein
MARALKHLAWFALAAGLTGCSGNLQVYGEDRTPIAGMPFRTAEVWVKQGTHDRASRGGKCEPVKFQEVLSLRTGPQYYVTATSSSFAKTAFHLKYNDAGGLVEVGLDSQPAGAENIKATADLVKTLAPLAGLAAAERVAKAPGGEPLGACDAGEADVTYQRLREYLRKHPAP